MAFSASDLFDLDPDDPRTSSQQVANALRAAILLGKLGPGDKLPSQHELSRRYGVARETIKSAVRILDREHLVVSRQGSGVFVRARRGEPLDLRGMLRAAFDRPDVTIDYGGFRGETLSNVLPDAVDVVRDGRVQVRSLRVRMLLVDPSATSVLPVPMDPHVNVETIRPSLEALTRRAVDQVTGTVTELADSGLVDRASVEVRVHRLGPSFKAYIFNDERVLFGFYPVGQHSIDTDSGPLELHHPSGWDATMFATDSAATLSSDSNSEGPTFNDQARQWFDSVWTTIAHSYN